MIDIPNIKTIMNRRQFLASALVVTALMTVPVVNAGALSNAVSRSLRKKIAKQTTSQAVGSRSTTRALTQAEKHALEKELLDLDHKTLARIESRYGQHISPAQLRAANSCKTCFLDKRQYDEHLRKAYPQLSAKERADIVGDYLKRPYVNHNRADMPRTLAHERLHQLSNDGRGKPFGGRFGEGITEHFSSRIYGDLGIRGAPAAYVNERRVIQKIQARVGEAPIARAYFRGDTRQLQQALDRQLGKGAFTNIVHYTERGQVELAERIIKHGL